MFPSKPLIDLATTDLTYNSNDVNVLCITIGLWCIGWALFYVGRKGFNDALNYVAFMAVITPTLTLGFSSGILFWSLVLMTVVNIAVWLYQSYKADSNAPHTV